MKHLIRYTLVLVVISVVAISMMAFYLPQIKSYSQWGYAFVRAPSDTWRAHKELRELLQLANDPHSPTLRKAISFQKIAQKYISGNEVPIDLALGRSMYGRALEEFAKVEDKKRSQVMLELVEGKNNFYKRCNSDLAFAQICIGNILTAGWAGRTNTEEAFTHFSKAAELGDPVGKLEIGWAYLEGRGVPKNHEIAQRWILASAESGVDTAQMLLGEILRQSSLEGDKIEAYKWMNLAAGQGNEIARKDRDEFEKSLSAEQLARAQGMSILYEQANGRNGDGTSSNTNNTAKINSRWMSGTCFFISSTGYLVTALHVVEKGKQFFVIDESALYVAKIVATDPTNDLALLQINGRMTSWNLEDNSGVRMVEEVTKSFKAIPIRVNGVRLGDGVATIGFPDTQLQGFSPKFTRGDISSMAGASDDPRYYQISVPVQPGNSGGPLLDSGGNVVGVISGQLQPSLALAAAGSLPQNVNYAVKGELLMALIKSVSGLSDYLPALNGGSDDLSNLAESAVHSVAMILASDASPPYTATILKDKK